MAKLFEKIKTGLRYVGLVHIQQEQPPLPYEPQKYQLSGEKNKLETHRDFLRNLQSEENNRLETLETKTSSLVSQSAIVFSLLSLFIPLLMDKASMFPVAIKVLLIFILILSSFFYLLTIRNAIKNYKLSDFKYIQSAPKNVIDFIHSSEELFIAEEVRDLLLAIPRNRHINDRKGTNLMHSYFAFKIANLMTGILIATFSISIIFYKPEKNSMVISEPVVIKNLDSLINIKVLTKDTITVCIKDSLYHVISVSR